MKEKIAYSYQDVQLIPKYSELESRSQADTFVEFLDFKFKLPVVPANMECVIDISVAKFLSENNYFYIYHRFADTYQFVLQANADNWKLISISLGVNETPAELDELANFRIDFITIDVAHGHHNKVKKQIQRIKSFFKKSKIIVGNVTTLQGCLDLQEWGADACKVGIAGGYACTTKDQTGFGIPMFSAIKECSLSTLPMIADGGIRSNGDFCKALIFARMVMAGSIFARCVDSPAKLTHAGKKIYYGSASFDCKKENKHIEGTKIELDPDISYSEKMIEIQQAIRSGISYAGGNNLNVFKSVNYIYLK